MVNAGLGNFSAAVSDFNQTLKIEPEFVDAYYNRGLIYYQRGNHKKAIVDFNQALKYNPKLADAYGNRGLANYALGDKRNAVADLRQAATLFRQQGDNQRYQLTLGILNQVENRF
jgi:tetratricopeptide (TPR) repeat protein